MAFVALVAMLISCKPSKEDALKYNDALVNEEILVIKAESAFTDAVINNRQNELDSLYQIFLKQIDISIANVNNIKPIGDENKFKDATLSLLSTYKSVVNNEYAEVLEIAKVPDDEFTQEHNNNMNLLSEKIDEKLEKEIQNFLNAQKELAKKYDLSIYSQNITK